MSFKTKLNLFSLLVLAIIPLAILWYYHNHHPKPVPPPPRKEINITIIPGWTLRQVADDWVEKGLIKTPDELFYYTGTPAADYRNRGEAEPVHRIVTSTDFDMLFSSKPTTVSYEGYLFPETYRVYADATVPEVLRKIFSTMAARITPDFTEDLRRQGKSFFDVLTVASILEREASTPEDKKMVADILWRRLKKGMPLQLDSTVSYIFATTGTVFTTAAERQSSSPWNTYQHKGLPLGPIANPDIPTLTAALDSTPNTYWYFLVGKDGEMRYAATYDEHLANIAKYLH